MRTVNSKRLLAAVPAAALAVGALGLWGSILASDGTQTSAGRSAARVDANGITPSALSPAVTARDWQETAGSVSKKPK